ncbi:MAG: acetone carboxylase subunit gamma [Candidatus Binatia bacterium]
MKHPLQENLEIFSGEAGSHIRCTQCSHVFCRHGEDWRQSAAVRSFPATRVNPLMSDFAEKLSLEQLFCPSCGSLLDSRMVGK